ncbi:MAG: hypothetical protein ACREP9_01870, partial [Candidatus Dormibacteraceae bacterium]
MAEIKPSALSGSAYHSIKPLPKNNPSQAGPNCGLYALSYVMRHWYEKLLGSSQAIGQPAPARKVDVEGPVKLPVGDPNKVLSLRSIAKQANTVHPLTFLGELFSGEALTSVATGAGFDAKIHKPDSKDYVKTLFQLIDANHPAIVSLDVDQDIQTASGGTYNGPNYGCPGQFGGEHAHWAVIVAYEVGWVWDDVVMFHWEKYFQFYASYLRDSSDQLVRFSGQTWFKPKSPTEQLLYDKKGLPIPALDRTTKAPLGYNVATARGKHWQKLESSVQATNVKLPGTAAWDATGKQPGAYA